MKNKGNPKTVRSSKGNTENVERKGHGWKQCFAQTFAGNGETILLVRVCGAEAIMLLAVTLSFTQGSRK